MVKVPKQIILDFEKPKLIKMREKFEKFLNQQNAKNIVPIANATGILVEFLKTEVEKIKV